MCASHSGEWNTNKKGEEIMPKPKTEYEKLIHVCDILASRPDIDYIIPKELLEILGEDTGEDLHDINEYVLPFGKHKGQTLHSVLAEDPGWIEWAKNEIKQEPLKTLLKSL